MIDRESPWWEANPKYRDDDVIIVKSFEFDRDPFDMVDDPATPGCWMESVKDKQEASRKLDENGDPIVEETAPATADVDDESNVEGDSDLPTDEQAEDAGEESADGETVEVGVDDDADESAKEGSGDVDVDGDEQVEGTDPAEGAGEQVEAIDSVHRKLTEVESVNATLTADVDKQREEINELKRELAESKAKCVEQAKNLRSIGASNAKLEADVSMLTESRDRLTEQVAAQDEELKAFATLKREQARNLAVSQFMVEQKWRPDHPRSTRFREKIETMPGWQQATADQAREFCDYHLGLEQSEKSAPPAEGFRNNVGGERKLHPITTRLG